MTVTPIGIYGPYPKKGEACSCYLVESDTVKIVLDLGSGALSKLQEYIDISQIDAIVLSHLHFDHFVDILPLSYVLKSKLKLFCPASPSDCFSLIKNRDAFDISVLDSGLISQVGDIKIEFLKVAHPVECYAVKLENHGNIMVYSGDIMEEGNFSLFAKNANLVLCDCASDKGTPHLTPEEGRMIANKLNARFLVAHLNPAKSYDSNKLPKKLELIVQGKRYSVKMQ